MKSCHCTLPAIRGFEVCNKCPNNGSVSNLDWTHPKFDPVDVTISKESFQELIKRISNNENK